MDKSDLSSGEISLRDHMLTCGKHIKEGQNLRLANLEIGDHPGGIFETTVDGYTFEEMARTLRENALKVYGAPARAFLRKITDPATRRAIMSEWDRARTQVLSVIPEKSTGEVFRVAPRFALAGYAGEWAIRLGILPMKPESALQTATGLLSRWIQSRGTGSGDAERAIQQVRLFLESHSMSRFVPADAADIPKTMNLAGFKEIVPGKQVTAYYILPEVYRSEVCKGFDPKMVSGALEARGMLETKSGRHESILKTLPEMGKIRVYAIRRSIFYESQEDLIPEKQNSENSQSYELF